MGKSETFVTGWGMAGIDAGMRDWHCRESTTKWGRNAMAREMRLEQMHA
jgi:hypothetical protein